MVSCGCDVVLVLARLHMDRFLGFMERCPRFMKLARKIVGLWKGPWSVCVPEGLIRKRRLSMLRGLHITGWMWSWQWWALGLLAWLGDLSSNWCVWFFGAALIGWESKNGSYVLRTMLLDKMLGTNLHYASVPMSMTYMRLYITSTKMHWSIEA